VTGSDVVERLLDIEQLAVQAGLGGDYLDGGLWADGDGGFFLAFDEATFSELHEGEDPEYVLPPTLQNRAMIVYQTILESFNWHERAAYQTDFAAFEAGCLDFIRAVMQRSPADRLFVAEVTETQELLAELLGDDSLQVRLAAAQNPNLDSETIATVVSELDETAREVILARDDVADHVKATIALTF
jgi:hypothetical protein